MHYGCARTGRLTGGTIDMRILYLFTALVLSFPNVVASQQAATSPSVQSPQRDPQAITILRRSFEAMGGPAGLALSDVVVRGKLVAEESNGEKIGDGDGDFVLKISGLEKSR